MSNPILEVINKQTSDTVGITGSPSTTIEINIDIKEESKLGRILGQMVYFVLQEEGQNVLVIGQVTSIETQNRWHQDPSFKGVIRLHGSLSHLSGRADNRVATISVQAAYALEDSKESDSKGHILGTSPSTGIEVKKMNNAVMNALKKKKLGSENIKAMFVRIIENEIKTIGEDLYTDGKKVNCLVVMDEAHRYISNGSSDPQIAELTTEIVDSVRTTRKYGIGYMFITQTIESLDKEILQQIRIFSFGYGLTVETEIKTISNLLNNESALQLYKSFIDPSSSHTKPELRRYPFMFFGSVSPLSFIGAPLFIEVYNNPSDFR